MPTHCLSHKELLRCGWQKGFKAADGGLAVGADMAGLFVSRIYDSGREGMEWNHLSFDIAGGAAMEVYVWLFDKAEELGEVSPENPGEWFAKHKEKAQYRSNYRNMLLYGHGRGRYARLAVEIQPGGEKEILFTAYDISFPKESFARYLPAIYQENPQLDRFLAVQQYIYLQKEKFVDTISQKLDYEFCSRNQAVRLAGWMGWGDLSRQVDKVILRKLLRTGIVLTGRKGTCDYYLAMTELLTGKKAVMVEEPEKRRAAVLVLEKPENGREKHLEWLRKNAPIGVTLTFSVLSGTDRLGGQYFLDKTSYLSQYESAILEQGCPIECIRIL